MTLLADPIVGDIPAREPEGDWEVPKPLAVPKPEVVTKWRYRTVYRKGYSLRAMALTFGVGGLFGCIMAGLSTCIGG